MLSRVNLHLEDTAMAYFHTEARVNANDSGNTKLWDVTQTPMCRITDWRNVR